jgi:hypothetical protein
MDIHVEKRFYGNEDGGAEMMDFSTVNSITIPEGAVKKITNSSGVVLWEGEITFKVSTTHTVFTVTVPSGSTWRDAASIYSTSDPYKFVISEDMIMGNSVEIEYYYGGARLATITGAKPDDVIVADKTYSAK